MPTDPRRLENILLHKFEFSPAMGRSVDHRWFVLEIDGIPSISTKISHSRAQINQNLESKISRQLRVRTPFFKEMIDCTKSKEDYYRQVQDDPYPPWDVHF